MTKWFADKNSTPGSIIDITQLNYQIAELRGDIRYILDIIQPKCDHCNKRNCTYDKDKP